jgi:hypothetical protein
MMGETSVLCIGVVVWKGNWGYAYANMGTDMGAICTYLQCNFFLLKFDASDGIILSYFYLLVISIVSFFVVVEVEPRDILINFHWWLSRIIIETNW